MSDCLVCVDAREQLQRGQNAVAGRRVVEQNHVPALLATDRVTVGAHGFEHVAVADRRLDDLDARGLHAEPEPEVRHDGRDDRALREPP